MDSKFKNKLSKYNHLKNIRDRLWSEDGKSRVSVMVGAGFSLNANKLDESLESMSTWKEIKSKILQGLNDIETLENQNVLDLSQRYVDEYGRESLDNILKQAVPDQNYEPGEVHKALLRLPWSEVFTTNYDTLLERTLPFIFERTYQVIYDSRDIPNSVSPRIVKLHGSFPSNRPFIFTRNDYENYYKDFAPLVNMVQQSIMETTLVLIGFSGDDPNFESWTKWVHENLGEHMPKIYMLAYDESNNEELLKDRGITLIDFKEIYEEEKTGNNVYKQMFTDVFEFLSYKDKKDAKDWPYYSYVKSYFNKEIDRAIEPFIRNRESYPGWLILPDIIKKKNIEQVQISCNELSRLIYRKDTELNTKIKVLNEIIWVYEIFKIPMDFHLHREMKEVVKEFLERNKEKSSLNSIEKIVFRLIKEARLDFNDTEFNYYIHLLRQHELDRDSNNRLKYELILMMMAKFEYEKANKELKQWLLTSTEVEWIVKKSIILSQLGDKDEAVVLLENSLNTVRKIISIKKDNYRLFSLEGIILTNLIYLQKNTLKSSKYRLSYLETKLANPLKELDFMYSRNKPYERKTGFFEKTGFDPNRVVHTTRFQSTLNIEIIDSFSMLLLNEELGLGIQQSHSKEAIRIALKNMEEIYPIYSWIMFLRIGNEKEIDYFFNREVVYRVDGSSLSSFFRIVVNGIKSKKNRALLLEILSRLYFSLKKEEKLIVDNLVIEVFKDKEFHIQNRFKAKNIFHHLFHRILFDKGKNEKEIFINEIYKLPIIGDPQGILSEVNVDSNFFYDPSFEFNPSIQLKLDVKLEEIVRLIKIICGPKSNIRDAAIWRLIFLKETGNVSDTIDAEIKSNISNIVKNEKSGFCNGLLDSYLVMITGDTELQQKYCNEMIHQSLPKSYNKNSGTTSIGNDFSLLLGNLKNIFPGFIDKNYFFSCINEDTYTTWLKVFFEWWKDQEDWLLTEQNDSLFGENEDLLLIVLFLKNSFLPNIPTNCITETDKKNFQDMYNKLKLQKREFAILLIPVFIRINIISENEIKEIAEGLMENSSKISNAAINAVYDLVLLKKQGEIAADINVLKSHILNLYMFRKEQTLLELTKIIGGIIHEIPNFFVDEEYSIIINTLSLIYKDFKNNYYRNSSISKQEFSLLAESTKLAGEIYTLNRASFNEKLEVWKELSKTNRLPEVRKNIYLFQKDL